MGAEMWQFAGMAGAGVVVVALWILLVYRPRRTGEGTPPVDPVEEEKAPGRD